MQQKVKIKLSKQEVVALRDLFVFAVMDYQAVGYQNIMVKAIMEEVLLQLDKMTKNYEQKRFTVRLTKVQAMGFVIFAGGANYEKIPYEGQIIRRMIEDIDRFSFVSDLSTFNI